jgi:hypothetical protein
VSKVAYTWHNAEGTFALDCPQCGTKMEPLEVSPPRSEVYLNAIQLCPKADCRYIQPWFPARRLV